MANRNTVTYEVSIDCMSAKTLRAARKLFAAADIPPGLLAEADDRGKLSVSYYTSSKDRAQEVRRKIAASLRDGTSVSLRSMRDIDWQTRWQKDFKPFFITGDIRIVPAWLKGRIKACRGRNIYIGSTMAFGTGMHPTTAAMAEFIEQKKGGFSSFLDVGTGTGILGLVAAAYGARTIGGVDISPDAVQTARDNFRRNRREYAFLRSGDFGQFKERRRFGFVAANILTPALMTFRDKLISCVRPGGFLAISGIWKDDYPRIVTHYSLPALRREGMKRRDGWIALLFRRSAE